MIVLLLLAGSLLGAVVLAGAPAAPAREEAAMQAPVPVAGTTVLAIRDDGTLALGGAVRGKCPGTAADEAFKQCVVRAIQGADLGAGVRVAADDAVPYARVVIALDALRERGVVRMALEAPP